MLACAALLGLAIVPGAASADLARCSSAAGDRSLCTRVTVPLDRSGAVPGTISLRVRELPPTHAPATGTVLALAGGPGQAAAALLDDIAAALGPALRSRALVAFDQRGTGGSGQLTCRALARDLSQASAVSQCAGEIGPARIGYTTEASVQDIEAVRAALGVDRLVLYGTSYGTKVALAYAAAYPQHVERLVLDSVVPPEGADPFQRMTFASIGRVLRTLCAHSCRFTRDPVRELAALVRKLAHAPLRGSIVDGRGHAHRVAIGRSDLLGLLIASDLDPFLRAAYPAAIHGALHGDPAPLLRMLPGGSAAESGGRGDSDALFIATTCEDGGVPWAPGTPQAQRRAAVDAAANALPDAAFAPFDRATMRSLGGADLCRGWPESPIAQPQPALPATPTLILSGDDDLRTPRAAAIALAARLPDAHLLEVPDAGHSVLGSDPTNCAESAFVAFLAGKVFDRCKAHRRALTTSGLPPRALRDVHAMHGLPRKAGRTVNAVVRTLGDLADQLIEHVISGDAGLSGFGGLRAGSAKTGRSGVRLRGYAFVPGVTLSGVLGTTAKGSTLTVGGSAAAHGRLTISAKGITGKLDGARVHVSAAQLRKASAAVAASAGQAPLRGPMAVARLPRTLRWPVGR